MMVNRYTHIGLSKEKKTELSNQKYISPRGEGWLDVKYRSAKFLYNLTNHKDGNYVVFTHGGFLSSMFASYGYQRILPHGTFIFSNVVSKKEKEIENLLEEYNEGIYKDHTKERVITDESYNKYSTAFENYIKSQIIDIDHVFTMPELEEEL
jgi:hypothetical protein